MRVFNIFFIVLGALVMGLLGLGLLAVGVSHGVRAELLSLAGQAVGDLNGAGWIFWSSSTLGAALLGFSIFAVWGNLQSKRAERAVVFHNPYGEVMIALGALEDLAKVVKNEVPGVKDARLRVRASRGALRATCRVVLWSDANLPKTTEVLQEAVRQYLQEVVGAEPEIRPRVIVTKVAFREPDEGAPTRRRPPRI